MQTINLLFRLPDNYIPSNQHYQLHTNHLFFGEARWTNNSFEFYKGSNVYYRLRFLPHAKGFYYLDEAEVVDNGLYSLYANAEDIAELEDEFHKEVIGLCLRECFPTLSIDMVEEMPLADLLPQLPFYSQPLYFPFEELGYLQYREDYYSEPVIYTTQLGIEFRKTGGGGFSYFTNRGLDYFPENYSLRSFDFFLNSIMGPNSSYKPTLTADFYAPIASLPDAYKYRLHYTAEYFFGKDDALKLELSEKFILDPFDPLLPLDYVIGLLKADTLLNVKKDYVGVAKILKHLSFFGGNELMLYYQLLGCSLARQGFLYEAERYKLRAVGLKAKYPLVYQQLGRIAAKQGRDEDAKRYFKESLDLERFSYKNSKLPKPKPNEATRLEYLLCLMRLNDYNLDFEYRIYREIFKRVKVPLDKKLLERRLAKVYAVQRKESIKPLLKDLCKASETE